MSTAMNDLRRRRWVIALAFCVLLLAGCHSAERSGGASKSPMAGTSEVTFKAADGWTIHADYTPAAGATKAVILLHQREGSARDWSALVPKLSQVKIASLAVDERGAGRSQRAQSGNDAPWDTTPDIEAA